MDLLCIFILSVYISPTREKYILPSSWMVIFCCFFRGETSEPSGRIFLASRLEDQARMRVVSPEDSHGSSRRDAERILKNRGRVFVVSLFLFVKRAENEEDDGDYMEC